MPALSWSMYLALGSARAHGGTAEDRSLMARNIANLGVSKVFIDVWRGQHADPDLVRSIRDELRAHDIEAAAGIMPSRGPASFGSNSRWGGDLCYTNPETWSELRRAMETGATLFDEFIIDDAFCTQCTCARCRAAKGDRPWGEFRRELLTRFAREVLVGASKAKNPRVKMILKFPQWYDRLAMFGYDTANMPPLFDATWIGTETRDPDTADFGFVPQYEACFNVRWHRVAEPNLEGAWFDPYDCDPYVYVEQAYQSVLGGARNLTLFQYGSLFHDTSGHHLAALRDAQPRLEALAARLDEQAPTGVAAYRPHNAEPADDGYLFDGLGMLGFPLVPVAKWPEDAPKALLVTDHAAMDEASVDAIEAVVAGGGTAFLTPSYLALRDGDERVKALAGFEGDGWSQNRTWAATEFHVGEDTDRAEAPVAFRFDLRPTSAEVLAWAPGPTHHAGERIPVVTRKTHTGGGRVVVVNVSGMRATDYRMDESINVPVRFSLLDLPSGVLRVVQNEIAHATGRAFLTPARVGYYPFSNGEVALSNFTDKSVVAVPVGEPLTASHREVLGLGHVVETRDSEGKATLGVRIPPRSTVLVGA